MNNNRTLISIVTPTYNAANYIKETMYSILNQETDCCIEHIIIDDGSKDNTPEVVNEVISQINGVYGKMFYYYRKENAGEQRAVNTGLEYVRGEYYMIVNADDPLLPDAVNELYYGLVRNPDCLGSYGDWMIIDEHGNHVRNMTCQEWDMKTMVRNHKFIHSVGSMYRSEVIQLVGGRDPQFLYIGDFDYCLRIGLQGDMVHVPRRLATWRRHSASMTAVDNPVRADQREVLVNKFYSLPGSEKYLSVKPEAYSWCYLVAATESKPLKRKLKFMLKALKINPSFLLTMTFWFLLFRYGVYYLKRYS